MKIFKKILFPVDFSEVSPKIAPWVLTVAKTFDAEIHLIFVARRLEYYSSVYLEIGAISDFQDGVIKGAEAKMEEFALMHFKEYPSCKTRVVLGDAGEEILNYVESEEIDLVIIGTHGRKGLERIIFGSVANKVVKMSPVPVLSINPYKVPSIEIDVAITKE